jgi:hypothetical protein
MKKDEMDEEYKTNETDGKMIWNFSQKMLGKDIIWEIWTKKGG